ncbi:uncharacterized protein SPPG_07569 [Spizellomyces punctatus DAOM BR117]|uniref:UBX domain-containing protein n=1 Tax=Spizellomyces punctatus (strain DAOM BR117) TaxID=645134 RepID=A0A0L0H7I7_SPIPD|nr:uncharacterized protein SPPG_07569 [Spizellomyces punctatus DAOM BR117]KNC97182.1 hypothetical protein SPPG_07569 [Spizellomyces punctatus DAOM BR117]|eukprot:XP_016605222.1 hypothetical protein SPPG_07569 [Spizellomyces punctatus DAOM BR117]
MSEESNDGLLASLMDMGFDYFISRKALADGDVRTVEDAVSWIIAKTQDSSATSDIGLVTLPPLQPSRPEPLAITNPFRSAEPSTSSINSVETQCTSTNVQEPDNPTPISLVSAAHLEERPSITSRHKTTRKTCADIATARALNEAKRFKKSQQESKIQILRQIKEDRETQKDRKRHVEPCNSIGQSPGTPKPLVNSDAAIQIRLPSGAVLRRAFSPSTYVVTLFASVRDSAQGKDRVDCGDHFTLLQPFPRRLFVEDECKTLSLQDAGLVPNASLNVMRCNSQPSSPSGPAQLAGAQPMNMTLEEIRVHEEVTDGGERDENTLDDNDNENEEDINVIDEVHHDWGGEGHLLTTDPVPLDTAQPHRPTRNPLSWPVAGLKRRAGFHTPVSLKEICMRRIESLLATPATPTAYLRSLRFLPGTIGSTLCTRLLHQNELNASMLTKLSVCPINTLDLSHYTLATDSLLRVIGERLWPMLTNLNLSGCEVVTDAGIWALKPLKSLEELDLSECRISDRVAHALPALTSLTSLSVAKTKITSCFLSTLLGTDLANSLRSLNLSYCTKLATADIFRTLSSFSQLCTLHLTNMPFKSPVASPPTGTFKELRYLDVRLSGITDLEVMNIICAFESLEELDTAGCEGISVVGLSGIARALQNLRAITFPSHQLTDDVLALFCEFPLHSLNLSNFVNLTDAAAEHISRLATTLVSLSLEGTGITDASLCQFEQLRSLTTLHLDRTHVGDAGICHLKPLRYIHHLSLMQTEITSEALRILSECEFNRTIRVLNVARTAVDDDGIYSLKGMVQLSALNLDFTRVTFACLETLAELPHLQPVRLAGIHE